MSGKTKRKLLVAVASVVGAFVVTNIIFGFILEEPDDSSEKRCIYSLYRLGVAIVEYANLKDTTMTPQNLDDLVEEGVVVTEWTRCSRLGPQHKYFGQFDLLGPRPPLVIWSENVYNIRISELIEKKADFCYALNGGFNACRYSEGALKEEVEGLDRIRHILNAEADDESLAWLEELVRAGEEPGARPFAIYRLGLTGKRKYEPLYFEIYENERGFTRTEAAFALARLGNPACGSLVIANLRSADYYERLRASKALRWIADGDFGYNPVLDAQLQEKVMEKIDAWWAATVKSFREKEKPKEK